MINFPQDFLWGTSTSGPQTEGRFAGDGKGDNLWDYWYQVEPHRFRFQEGPGLTSTFYENWEEEKWIDVSAGEWQDFICDSVAKEKTRGSIWLCVFSAFACNWSFWIPFRAMNGVTSLVNIWGFP